LFSKTKNIGAAIVNFAQFFWAKRLRFSQTQFFSKRILHSTTKTDINHIKYKISRCFTQKCEMALTSMHLIISSSLQSRSDFPVTIPALLIKMSTSPISDFT